MTHIKKSITLFRKIKLKSYNFLTFDDWKVEIYKISFTNKSYF